MSLMGSCQMCKATSAEMQFAQVDANILIFIYHSTSGVFSQTWTHSACGPYSFHGHACLNWHRGHVLNMPIKRVPLQRSGTCMLVTFGGSLAVLLLGREFISLSVIPQMFALISSWLRDFGSYFINHPKRQTQAKWKMFPSKSEYSQERQERTEPTQGTILTEPCSAGCATFREEKSETLVRSHANRRPQMCFLGPFYSSSPLRPTELPASWVPDHTEEATKC